LSAAQIDRAAYAHRVEGLFLENGFDAYVSTVGQQKDILRIKYVLMSRPLIYKVMTRDTFKTAGKIGFKKLIFENDSQIWLYYWDGNNWLPGKSPEEIAADKAKVTKEAERKRKQEEAENARAEELYRAEQERKRLADEAALAKACPDGKKRVLASYGSYCQ
jgi:hypothetical protein